MLLGWEERRRRTFGLWRRMHSRTAGLSVVMPVFVCTRPVAWQKQWKLNDTQALWPDLGAPVHRARMEDRDGGRKRGSAGLVEEWDRMDANA